MLTILRRHPLPGPLSRVESDFALDVRSRVALCTVELPDFTKLQIVKKGAKWTAASEGQRKRASDHILHALCIRAAYLVAMGDPGDFFDTVAVNAHQKWFDPATGHSKTGIVASLQAPKRILCQLEPGRLDPTACFRHLSGISSPNLLNAAPIRPIFVMNTNDNRIVASKDVTSHLQETTNLAAMPWEDFEHLVGQIFEWLFANDGVEVKVTRASRDRGVDAIILDPDPIRGGKFVLQAKRYTNTVDVAAVRDLYGTVINEGANRGILVTTASYGPDAYEFAKDKPISLIDGPNLIELLKRHGRIYRIDLEEARRAN
jgi:restriction system protein